jgi:PKD repeat protein/Tol biopolymer transport system component
MFSLKRVKKFTLPLLILLIGVLVAACNLGTSPEQQLDITSVPTGSLQPTRTPIGTLSGTSRVPTSLPLTPFTLPTRPANNPRPTSIAVFPTSFVRFPTNTPLPISIFILSPIPGNTVAGNVQVIGSASHPNFLQYQLEYSPDPNPGNLWFLATGVVQTPMQNGLLGIWNTTATQDGVYQLRLRVFLRDGTDLSTIVNNVRVQNRAATPIPSPTSSIPRPIAAFTQNLTSGNAPLVVSFSNLSSGQISAYTWDFGDGSGSTEISPTHTFRNPGVFNVTLTANGPGGSSNVSQQILVNGSNVPVAAFTQNRVSGPSPLTVQFTNQSTGSITTYEWIFGDGNTSNQQNPSNTFTAVGTYNVILRVTGPGGQSSVTRQITVENPQVPPPDAIFAVDVTSGQTPLTVRFANQSTGNIVSQSWDFGDGSAVSTEQSPVHVYSAAGTFTVTLRVIGPGGQDTATTTITTTAPPNAPVARFSAAPSTGDFPLDVTFTNTSTDATSYSWNFGDGGTSTQAAPTHRYTAAGTYTVTLTANGAGGSDTETTTITVTQPIAPPNADFTADVNSGRAALTVRFTNNSTGDNLTFEWNFDDGATSTERNPVHIFNDDGVYDVTLRASNSEGDDVANMTITVTDANQAPTDISISDDSIEQNASVGTPVGTLSATDPDSGETFTFSGSNAQFNVSGNQVLVAGALTAGAQTINVTVTDSASNTYSETLTINVTTVNSAPTDINLTPSSVAQNATAGTPVGTLTAVDPDSGETFTFSGSNAQFSVSGNQVVVAGALTAGDQTIDVTVTDSAGNDYTETLTINVTTVNSAPTGISLSPDTVAQNANSGDVIGTLSATDPDSGETFTFSGSNGQFSVSGNQVVVAGALTAGTQTLDVTVTDSAGNTFTDTIDIEVTTVNSAPTDISLSPDTVAQNASAGTVVGTLSATDPDSGETFTFSGGDGQFSVNGDQVVVAGALSSSGPQNFSVTVTDSAGNPYSEVLVINVTTVNSAPTDITLSPDTVAQNASAGTVVGTLTATDPDSGDTFTFSGGDGQFSVSGNQVVVAGALGSGAQSFNVSVTDSAGNPYSETLTINVTAVTQPPVNVPFVFVSEGNLYSGVFDGTNYINITPITNTGGVSSPVWSPNGQYVAFVANGALYAVDPNNPGTVTPITDPGGAPITGGGVIWVDNDTLGFVSNASGSWQIYTTDVNTSGQGTTPVQLTTEGTNYSPTRSPDGRIAFVSERNGEVAQIYVMNGDGSNQTKLYNDPAHAQTDPAWSPNGNYIAFVYQFDASDQDIWRMNSDGSSPGPMDSADTEAVENNPGWSPDSSLIIFQANGATYIMNADGSGGTPISAGTAQTIDPTWRPN